MADLLSAIMRASKVYADPLVVAYTSGNRPYMVRITRPSVLPTFNRDTNVFTNPDDVLIYQGPARIAPASMGARVDFGGEEQTMTSVEVSIDDTVTSSPRVDDIVKVLSDPLSLSTQIADREFTVTGVSVGGHFNTGFQLSATGTELSRRTV